jgi:hypothetical protein
VARSQALREVEAMNREQLVGLLRHLLPFIGGIAIGGGYISEEGWTIFSEQFLEFAGPAITLGGLIWSYMDKTDKALVEKVIAMPEVSKIECMPTKEGKALAESVPNEDVVAEDVSVTVKPAGMSAKRVAQAYPRMK